jgi:hypothetical protein
MCGPSANRRLLSTHRILSRRLAEQETLRRRLIESKLTGIGVPDRAALRHLGISRRVVYEASAAAGICLVDQLFNFSEKRLARILLLLAC